MKTQSLKCIKLYSLLEKKKKKKKSLSVNAFILFFYRDSFLNQGGLVSSFVAGLEKRFFFFFFFFFFLFVFRFQNVLFGLSLFVDIIISHYVSCHFSLFWHSSCASLLKNAVFFSLHFFQTLCLLCAKKTLSLTSHVCLHGRTSFLTPDLTMVG